MTENREMFTEINALVGAIAKALDMDEKEVVAALESNRLAMALGEDESGNRFVEAKLGDKAARVYPGAIHHQG